MEKVVLDNTTFVNEMEKIDSSILKLSRKEYDFDNNGITDIIKALRNGDGDLVPIGQEFSVPHNAYGTIEFVVRRFNVDKVAGDEARPTITIQPKYLLSASGGSTASTFQYDRAEAFCSVDEAIPANTVCKFTTTTSGSWEAGTYMFTPTSEIASGSKLCINGNNTAALTSRKVSVYSSAKGTTASASYNISVEDGTATLNLGIWGTDLNVPSRVSFGSNNEAESNIFQWLNGIGLMSDIWVPKTKYDMMCTSYTSLNGFLGGFSETFRSYLGLCAIHNITNDVFESQDSNYTVSQEYTHNGYFWLPSRKEIYGSNENTRESSETQFAYYANIATTNADKLMYAKGASSATSYWLRTPYASGATNVRHCYTGSGGALASSGAYISYGVAPLGILA